VLLRYAVTVLFLLRTAQGLAGFGQKAIQLQEAKELVRYIVIGDFRKLPAKLQT
jgi:hypothetical protein